MPEHRLFQRAVPSLNASGKKYIVDKNKCYIAGRKLSLLSEELGGIDYVVQRRFV